jgi:hypothetical protein
MAVTISIKEFPELFRMHIEDCVSKALLPTEAIYEVVTSHAGGVYTTEVTIADSLLADGSRRTEPVLALDEVVAAIGTLWAFGVEAGKHLPLGTSHNLDVNYLFPNTSPAWLVRSVAFHERMKTFRPA